MITAEEHVNQIVQKTIPIYTIMHPDPVKKKADCNLTKDYKRRLREAMKKEIAVVISKYTDKAKGL